MTKHIHIYLPARRAGKTKDIKSKAWSWMQVDDQKLFDSFVVGRVYTLNGEKGKIIAKESGKVNMVRVEWNPGAKDGQKPYVSGTAEAWEVLNSQGKVAKRFPKNAAGGQLARRYLEENWRDLVNDKAKDGAIGKKEVEAAEALAEKASQKLQKMTGRGTNYPAKEINAAASESEKLWAKFFALEKEFKKQTKDATNHLNEKEYRTFASWKLACRSANNAVTFEGDKDICQAKPGVGEWDGEKGVVYARATKDVMGPKFDDLPLNSYTILFPTGKVEIVENGDWSKVIRLATEFMKERMEGGKGHTKLWVEGKRADGSRRESQSLQSIHLLRK